MRNNYDTTLMDSSSRGGSSDIHHGSRQQQSSRSEETAPDLVRPHSSRSAWLEQLDRQRRETRCAKKQSAQQKPLSPFEADDCLLCYRQRVPCPLNSEHANKSIPKRSSTCSSSRPTPSSPVTPFPLTAAGSRDKEGRRKSLSVLSETSSESSWSSSSSSLEEVIRIKWIEKRAKERSEEARTVNGNRAAHPPRSKPAQRDTRDDDSNDDASDATWKVTNRGAAASAAAWSATVPSASAWTSSGASTSFSTDLTPAFTPIQVDEECHVQQAIEACEALGRQKSRPEAASNTATIPLGSSNDEFVVGPHRASPSSDRKELWESRKVQGLFVLLIIATSSIVIACIFAWLL